MNVREKIEKYLQYIDQGIYSLCTLLLSLLAPVFFSAEQSAEILYLISFLLLFLAVTTAIFTTQMLSIHDEKNEAVEKVFILFVLTILISFIVTFFWHLFIGLKSAFFLYFSYLFCCIDFLRRLFIRQGKELWSLYISIACILIIPISYYISSALNLSLWKVAFFPALLTVLFALNFYIKNFQRKTNYDIFFLKIFIKNGLLALSSFFLVWCATQGIFIIFYETVESAVFVEQKLIFSVLGFFNIIMIVQENKYQPLYTLSVANKDLTMLKAYDKSVNIESNVLLGICIILFIGFYIFKLDFYISFLLFAIFRYFLGLSKAPVYYFRAVGKYVYLVISNIFALSILGLLYIYFENKINIIYVIPVYFLIHASVFLSAILFFRFRSIYAKHWGV